MVLGVGDRLCCPEPWGESQTIPLPQLRFLPTVPSGVCLSPKSLLSPKIKKRLLRAAGVSSQEIPEGSFPSQASGNCCRFLGGEDVQGRSHTGAAERRRVTDWKPQGNLPGGWIHPEIKVKGSLAVGPHGFHSKSSAFAVLCIQPG